MTAVTLRTGDLVSAEALDGAWHALRALMAAGDTGTVERLAAAARGNRRAYGTGALSFLQRPGLLEGGGVLTTDAAAVIAASVRTGPLGLTLRHPAANGETP